jgi:hypothetical protein
MKRNGGRQARDLAGTARQLDELGKRIRPHVSPLALEPKGEGLRHMKSLPYLLLASLLLLFVAPPASAHVVSLWAGENNADDSVGDNDGTINGSVGFRAGTSGQGFDFTAGSVTVSGAIAGGLAPASGFSIVLFAGQDTFVGGEEMVSLLSNGNDSGFILSAHPSTSGTLRFRVYTSSGANTIDATGFTVGEAGHWIVVTFDAASHALRLYHGNELMASGTAGGTNMKVDGDESFAIGDGWNGLIDEVSFYDEALSQGEIDAIFGAGDGELIFDDDFESGNMSSWSDSVP